MSQQNDPARLAAEEALVPLAREIQSSVDAAAEKDAIPSEQEIIDIIRKHFAPVMAECEVCRMDGVSGSKATICGSHYGKIVQEHAEQEAEIERLRNESERAAAWQSRAEKAEDESVLLRQAVSQLHLAKSWDGRGACGWMVYCPAGHEFDSLAFGNQADAQAQADLFNDELPEGVNPFVPIPLFRGDEVSKLRSVVAAADRMREDILAECYDENCDACKNARAYDAARKEVDDA